MSETKRSDRENTNNMEIKYKYGIVDKKAKELKNKVTQMQSGLTLLPRVL